jgi:hypothetical protein
MTAKVIAKAIASPIIRNQQLTVEDLKKIPYPMTIQGNTVTLMESKRGYKLKQPVTLNLDKVLAAKERGLVQYVLSAFLSDRPTMIPYIFDNQSLLKVARHLLRHCSGSSGTFTTYTVQVRKYAEWLGYSPDLIIADTKPVGNIPDPQRVQNHTGYINDYLAWLQDEGIKPGPVNNYIKSVKTFYRVNGVRIDLIEPLSRRVTYKDRAPKPEELEKRLTSVPTRQSHSLCLALGAFREETLANSIQTRQRRIENNTKPIHVHIEADITKGKYHDYDTFLGAKQPNTKNLP